MQNVFFLHQIKRTNGIYDKGIVVKDTHEAVLQSYHAYLGAYAYGKDPATDFVSCMITDSMSGNMVFENEVWNKPEVLNPEEPAPVE